jgi:nitrile hydratase
VSPLLSRPFVTLCVSNLTFFFGMTMFFGGVLEPNLDAFRHALERLSPAVYLSGYYARWLAGFESRLVANGFLAEGELDARLAGRPPPARESPASSAPELRDLLPGRSRHELFPSSRVRAYACGPRQRA